MMEPKEKKAFEPSGLVPRSIVRTFERFRQQLLPGSERAAIREYRISRYQVLVSARCLFTLLTIPIATNWLVSSWLLSPLIEHFWNTQQDEIFLNSYQEERAFAELEFFSEKLFFESLLNNAGFTESPTSEGASYFLPLSVQSSTSSMLGQALQVGGLVCKACPNIEDVELCTTDNSNNFFTDTIASNFTKTEIFPLEEKIKSPRFENFALKNELSTVIIGCAKRSFANQSSYLQSLSEGALHGKGQEVACAFGRGKVIGCAKRFAVQSFALRPKEEVLHSPSFGRKAKLCNPKEEKCKANPSQSTGVAKHALQEVDRILINLNPKTRHNLSTTSINQQNIPSLSFRNFSSKKDPLSLVEETKVRLGGKYFPLKDDGKAAEMTMDLVSLTNPPTRVTRCTSEIFTSLEQTLQSINKPSSIVLPEKKFRFYSDIVSQMHLQSDASPICNNKELPEFHSLLKETVGDKQMFNSRSCIEKASPFQFYKSHRNNKLKSPYLYPTYEQEERRGSPGSSRVSSSIYSFQNQSWNTPEGDKSPLLLSMGKNIKESTALTPAKKLEVEGCDTVPFYEKSINYLPKVHFSGVLCNDKSIKFLKVLFSNLELNFHKPLKETDLYMDSINVGDKYKYSKKNTGEAPTINPIQLFFRGPSISKPIHFEKESEGKSKENKELSTKLIELSLQSSTSFMESEDLQEGKKMLGQGLPPRYARKKKLIETKEINRIEDAKFHASLIEEDINSLKIKEQVQDKILELAVYYNQQTISSITNIIGDLVSLFTLGCLFIWMKPEITILKSFLIEAIYSLSDTTKSFLLILLTDLLVGFHSPRGWETALELLLKHFGLPENQDFVFLFVATFPVLLDTVFKYWIFRHLNKISPSTVATYHSMIE